MELSVLVMFVILRLRWCEAMSHAGQKQSDSLEHFTPAYLIFGTRTGYIWKCLLHRLTSCKKFYSGSSSVLATLVHDEYLFASHTNGEILKCYWDKKECTVFHQADDRVTSLAVAGGFLYAANNHVMLRCKISQPQSCSRAYSFDESVKGIYRHDKYIYATTDHNLLRCSGDDKCQRVSSVDTDVIIAVSGWGGNIITLLANGTVWTLNFSLHVSFSRSFPSDVFGMSIFKGFLYVVSQGILRTCKLDKATHCMEIHLYDQVTSMSFIYATHKKRRVDSISRCSQLGASPVFNYQEEHRALMEVSVVNGKLVDARGVPVDTRQADVGNSGRAAVFAMGRGGQLLLSMAHRSGLVHITSFFAGPVAGAGEIIVQDGVVKKIVACSEHYRADVELNKQVVEELNSRGYTRAWEIELEECTYTCDRY